MSEQPKQLVFRLSSLGDILLSMAYLENLPENQKVDWVTSKEFSFLLKNHPKIDQLIVFDKSTGMQGWAALLKSTLATKYSARVDLHVTLRTRLAKVYFLIRDLLDGEFTPWRSISKERTKTFFYLLLKSLWPSVVRPTRYWKRFAALADPTVAPESGALRPPQFSFALKPINLETLKLREKEFLAVMPASRWSSKEWGTKEYLSLLEWVSKNTQLGIVLLGRKSDLACADLSEELLQKNIPFTSLLDEPDFAVTASVLSKAFAFLGSDTGLAHLSEAVGTQAWVIYGPTRPDLGFGPRMPESVAITGKVFCSPCSKDGKVCYRFWQPYECLKQITPEQIQRVIQYAHASGSIKAMGVQ